MSFQPVLGCQARYLAPLSGCGTLRRGFPVHYLSALPIARPGQRQQAHPSQHERVRRRGHQQRRAHRGPGRLDTRRRHGSVHALHILWIPSRRGAAPQAAAELVPALRLATAAWVAGSVRRYNGGRVPQNERV
jgi:hypothetical protein